MGGCQREAYVFHKDSCHVISITRHWQELIVKLGGDTAKSFIVCLCVEPRQPCVPRGIVTSTFFVIMGEIYYIVVVPRRLAVVRVTTVTGTKVCAEGAARGSSGDGLVGAHVTELGTAAEDVHVAVDDGGGEVACHRFGGIEAAGIELLDVGVMDEPSDVACIVSAIGLANTLHSSTAYGAEATAVDVALGVVCVIVQTDIGYIKSREVELIEIATSNRNGRMLSWLESCCYILILVTARVEFLEPHVTSYMDVGYLV